MKSLGIGKLLIVVILGILINSKSVHAGFPTAKWDSVKILDYKALKLLTKKQRAKYFKFAVQLMIKKELKYSKFYAYQGELDYYNAFYQYLLPQANASSSCDYQKYYNSNFKDSKCNIAGIPASFKLANPSSSSCRILCSRESAIEQFNSMYGFINGTLSKSNCNGIESGAVPCNPFFFGMKSDSEFHCVNPSNKGFTNTCSEVIGNDFSPEAVEKRFQQVAELHLKKFENENDQVERLKKEGKTVPELRADALALREAMKTVCTDLNRLEKISSLESDCKEGGALEALIASFNNDRLDAYLNKLESDRVTEVERLINEAENSRPSTIEASTVTTVDPNASPKNSLEEVSAEEQKSPEEICAERSQIYCSAELTEVQCGERSSHYNTEVLPDNRVQFSINGQRVGHSNVAKVNHFKGKKNEVKSKDQVLGKGHELIPEDVYKFIVQRRPSTPNSLFNVRPKLGLLPVKRKRPYSRERESDSVLGGDWYVNSDSYPDLDLGALPLKSCEEFSREKWEKANEKKIKKKNWTWENRGVKKKKNNFKLMEFEDKSQKVTYFTCVQTKKVKRRGKYYDEVTKVGAGAPYIKVYKSESGVVDYYEVGKKISERLTPLMDAQNRNNSLPDIKVYRPGKKRPYMELKVQRGGKSNEVQLLSAVVEPCDHIASEQDEKTKKYNFVANHGDSFVLCESSSNNGPYSPSENLVFDLSNTDKTTKNPPDILTFKDTRFPGSEINSTKIGRITDYNPDLCSVAVSDRYGPELAEVSPLPIRSSSGSSGPSEPARE